MDYALTERLFWVLV